MSEFIAHFAIVPALPTTDDDITLELVVDDLDGDGYTAVYSWLKDGETTGYTNDTVFADMITDDEIWTAIDGTNSSRFTTWIL